MSRDPCSLPPPTFSSEVLDELLLSLSSLGLLLPVCDELSEALLLDDEDVEDEDDDDVDDVADEECEDRELR